jgi:hypothetical protein
MGSLLALLVGVVSIAFNKYFARQGRDLQYAATGNLYNELYFRLGCLIGGFLFIVIGLLGLFGFRNLGDVIDFVRRLL